MKKIKLILLMVLIGISVNVYSLDLKALSLGSGNFGRYYVGPLEQCINGFMENGEIYASGGDIIKNPSVSVSGGVLQSMKITKREG